MSPADAQTVKQELQINPVVVFLRGSLTDTVEQSNQRLLELLGPMRTAVVFIDIATRPDTERSLRRMAKGRDFPLMYIRGHLLGDLAELEALAKNNQLRPLLKAAVKKRHFVPSSPAGQRWH